MPGTFEAIATTTLNSSSASIAFDNIPATYTDLRVVLYRATGGNTNLYLQFNADGGSTTNTNYGSQELLGYSTTLTAATQSSAYGCYVTNAQATGTSAYVCTFDVLNYVNSTKYKTILHSFSGELGGGGWTGSGVSVWRNTATITKVTIFSPNAGAFDSGTKATVYGIKAA
jgi:hypothetical protein